MPSSPGRLSEVLRRLLRLDKGSAPDEIEAVEGNLARALGELSPPPLMAALLVWNLERMGLEVPESLRRAASADPAARVGAARCLCVDDAGSGHVVDVVVTLHPAPRRDFDGVGMGAAGKDAAREAVRAALRGAEQPYDVMVALRRGARPLEVDGASLGLAVYLATWAASRRRQISPSWAFTGEVDPSGRVSEVGSLDRKLAGLPVDLAVAYPASQTPSVLGARARLHGVSHVDDALALLGHAPLRVHSSRALGIAALLVTAALTHQPAWWGRVEAPGHAVLLSIAPLEEPPVDLGLLLLPPGGPHDRLHDRAAAAAALRSCAAGRPAAIALDDALDPSIPGTGELIAALGEVAQESTIEVLAGGADPALPLPDGVRRIDPTLRPMASTSGWSPLQYYGLPGLVLQAAPGAPLVTGAALAIATAAQTAPAWSTHSRPWLHVPVPASWASTTPFGLVEDHDASVVCAPGRGVLLAWEDWGPDTAGDVITVPVVWAAQGRGALEDVPTARIHLAVANAVAGWRIAEPLHLAISRLLPTREAPPMPIRPVRAVVTFAVDTSVLASAWALGRLCAGQAKAIAAAAATLTVGIVALAAGGLLVPSVGIALVALGSVLAERRAAARALRWDP